MTTPIRKAVAATAAALLATGAFASSALAYTFADHVQITSGNHYAGAPYIGGVTAVSVASYGSAFSGTWINDSPGTGGSRVSVDNYCNTAGCTVQIGWPGAKPNGYGTAENHGNASPSYFQGVIN